MKGIKKVFFDSNRGRKMKNKSCGCLVGAAVISSEIEKRKKAVMVAEINKKLKKAKSKSVIKKLKDKKKAILSSIKEATAKKSILKSRFADYIKKSGYIAPKFKKKRWY